MGPVLNTVFVLGAGFSVEQGYPLARTMREKVIDFLVTEQHSEYQGFLEPGSRNYREGPFYAGLQRIDPDEEIQFEELLLKLAPLLKQDEELFDITDQVLRTGATRLLWDIHKSIEDVAPTYRETSRLGSKWGGGSMESSRSTGIFKRS